MSLLYSLSLSSTFAGVATLQANGASDTGVNLPNGIGDSLYISGGCMVAYLREFDAVTAAGHRCEIIPGAADALGNERWYTWEWMAPSWPINDAGCSGDQLFSIMQIHDTAGPARSPNFELWYNGIGLLASIPLQQPPTEMVNYRGMGSILANQGVWHSLALHAIWSNAGAGLFDFYVNRIPIFKARDIGTAYNADAPYLKLGVYNYQGLTGYGERVSCVRNVKVYSTGDLLIDILGGQPVCRSFAVK